MSTEHDLVYIAVITAVPATIAAIAALSGAHNAKRARRESAAAQDTGNEKKLGHTVHDIAQTVEVISAQVHTNSTEILDISRKLDGHLDETAPLVERYVAETKAAGERAARKKSTG